MLRLIVSINSGNRSASGIMMITLLLFLLSTISTNVIISAFVVTTTTTTTTNTQHNNPIFKKLEASTHRRKTSCLFMGGGSSGFANALLKLQWKNYKFSGTVRPGKQSPQKQLVDNESDNINVLKIPDYATDGIPKGKDKGMMPWTIETKSQDEINLMKKAGRCAREVLDIAGRSVKVGITTDEIDCIVHDETLKRGAYPSPLNYHGFPKSCCTSVNEVICHGIPDDRPLEYGDVINIDITCYLNGYHGDCSEMYIVGGEDALDDVGKDLIQTTYDCWIKSCNYVKPGRDYKDIGGIIEDYVTPKGYTTVKQFCGHGIGSIFHCNPNILHYKNSEPMGSMVEGHTFTIEPMICEGSAKAITWPDQWTATTVDGKRSVQFEHTLLVTNDGVEALTGKIETSPIHFWEKNSKIHQGVWLGTSEYAKEQAAILNKDLL